MKCLLSLLVLLAGPLSLDAQIRSETARLSAPSGAANDLFGLASAIDGDRVLIGAEGRTVVQPSDGAAYLFTRDPGGSGFSLTKEFLPAGLRPGSGFGIRVALQGDVAACADFDGNVVLYARNAGGADNWGEEKRLSFATTPLGPALALDHDLLVVGDPGAKAVHLYERNLGGAGQWGLRKTLRDPLHNVSFGALVSVSGDAVFVTRLPVGVVLFNFVSGQVYVYERNQGGTDAWGLVQTLHSPDGSFDDMFGQASVDGDLAVVGAYTAHSLAGAAYLYERTSAATNPWQLVRTFLAPDHASLGLFGRSVAIEGDLLVAGTYGDFTLSPMRGSAHVYLRNLGGTDAWGALATLIPSTPVEPGFLVSDISGGTVLGTNLLEGQQTGAAYVFDVARASNSPRNGAGRNTPCYSSVTPPRIGAPWVGTADTRAHPGAQSTLLVAYERPHDGTFLPMGEILLDLGSQRLFVGVAGVVGGSSSHAVSLPSDPALIGFAFSSQLLILGGSPELCNALDHVVGP